MFYSTLCLKMGAYFRNGFEINTAERKLLGFTIPHLVADSTSSNRIVSLDTCILCDERSFHTQCITVGIMVRMHSLPSIIAKQGT